MANITSFLNVGQFKRRIAPLAPQLWGEELIESPPELGDLGGKKNHYSNSEFIQWFSNIR
ncbi:MAG: hypothetical protein DCF12_09395 [Snowella sp.]|nr:MAG: hypothetical protein DCF12_09395 [Snowella sp.]